MPLTICLKFAFLCLYGILSLPTKHLNILRVNPLPHVSLVGTWGFHFMTKNLQEKRSPKELVQTLLTYLLVYLFGILSNNFPSISVLSGVAQLLPKKWLLILIIIQSIGIVYLLLTFNNPPEIEFIARYNLRWKKKGNNIDPHPFCLCCDSPSPLKSRGSNISDHGAEYLFCPKTDKTFWAMNETKTISYKEAYKLICKE